MLAFEILVNGKKLCKASTADHSMVSTIVAWAESGFDFHVSAIASVKPERYEVWRTPALHIGDEVCIRLIDSDESDPSDESEDL